MLWNSIIMVCKLMALRDEYHPLLTTNCGWLWVSERD
jgi:hypothetical protein